jgi:dynein intermediate chain 2
MLTRTSLSFPYCLPPSLPFSHSPDPVYDVFWIQSKTNNQFASVSTDGRMLWWDTRKLSEPTDEVILGDGSGRVLGGTSMEYNIEAGPAKYLVGTEQGIVLSMNMKKKGAGKPGDACTPMDTGPGKHHGPIYSIQRNPFHPSNYMTVGDWGVRFWTEKNKTPIMQTPYSKSYLTAGCWSPTRAGLFLTTRQDGVLDAWDFYYRQSTPTYSHKVADVPLSCISVQGSAQSGGGRLVAVGDASGTVSLLELSENLAVTQPNEKLIIGNMFDRESKREENLEKRAIALARAAKAAKADPGSGAAPAGAGAGDEEAKDPEMEETLRGVDKQFRGLMGEVEPEAEGSVPAAEAGAAKKEGDGEGEGGEGTEEGAEAGEA